MTGLLDRRGFVGTILGVLVLGRAAAAAVAPAGKTAAGLKFLTPDEARLIAALARRLVGRGDVDHFDLVAWVDREIALGNPASRRRLRALLGVVGSRWAALLTAVGWQPFVELPADRQERLLRSWMRSRLLAQRAGFSALKRLILLGYYSDPRSWSAIGYDGPWLRTGDGTPAAEAT